jgi:hypothetical protein
MNKVQVFISYSHKDNSARQEFEKWLVALKDNGMIASWSDINLIPGDKLMSKISKKMDEADIIVLLLSQDYLASKSCKDEMNYALNAPQKKVVPIILKDCTWLETGCKELLALPKDGLAINKWENMEDAWQSVYKGMKNVVIGLHNSFDIRDDFLKELQKIEFATQSNKMANLDEIFVFPNLKRYTDAFKTEDIKSDFFLEMREKSILIRGREFSGKTALLKWLFLKLREKYFPIILDAENIHKSKNFDEHLEKEFSNQLIGDFETWLSKDNKVALIDNFSHHISSNIIDYLSKNFSMTIIAVDDEEYLLYFKDDPGFTDFTIMSIAQLNLVQQENLIRIWVQTSQQIASDNVSDLEVDKLEARVNNVITTQRIVPRYPFYVLSIIQTLETFMPSDINITAYGHCYLALVTAQLIKKNIKPEDIDSCFNYLKHLSYSIYDLTSTGNSYTAENYHEFREAYKAKFIISDSLINKVENEDYAILDIQNNRTKFDHSYIYYFFLGMYLATLEENEKIIDYLCTNIHQRQNAFILIFTIHHTQNKALLDAIRLHSMVSFEDITPAILDTTETEFMNGLIAELPQSIISNKSTQANREEQRKKKSHETDSETSGLEGEEQTPTQERAEVSVVELNRGMKIMEVLGQILKNRAGSFEKKDVEEILEDTVNLGLRILNLFLGEYKKPEFEDWLTKMLKEKEQELEKTHQKEFDDERRKEFIRKTIQFFGYVVTISMLSRISEAITAEKLTESMFVLSEKKLTPAYELINHLVSSSQDGIDVDHVRKLLSKYNKSKNYWAERVLSHYVQMYLNTHKVNYKDRQKLFTALDLKYLPNKAQ